MNKLLFHLIIILFTINLYAKGVVIEQLPAKLTADKIGYDTNNKTIFAEGNAEFTKGGNSIFANKINYFQNKKTITAIGNIRLDNYQMGNMSAKNITFKDDFKNGKIDSPLLIFFDGSYIKSKEATKKNKITNLKKSIYSICPNDNNSGKYEIVTKREPISISSQKTIIDSEDESIKLKHSIVKIYDFPILYSPYFKTLFPASKRKSGFLTPSYLKTQNLGFGITLPYYFNINNNKDLTVKTSYFPNTKHFVINNKFRHLIKYGNYDLNLEFANNNLNVNNKILITDEKTQKREIRGKFSANGNFILSKFSDLNININHVGDKEYLRDYKNDFTDHTISIINLFKYKEKQYNFLKIVNIQELSTNKDKNTSPLALPILESYIETKPKYIGETYSLLSNMTLVTRREGMQYRRISLVPEIKLPYNIYGNLFQAKLNIQNNIYQFHNGYKYTNNNQNYQKNELNHYPRISFEWKLPLARKDKNNMIIFEPLVNFISSASKDKNRNLYNEDVNNNELNQSNIFLEDRLIGFDRNETGKRLNYGFNTYLFNKLGKFNFNLGQSKRSNNIEKNVAIRGFNDNNKSNLVGKFSYENKGNFSLIYNFHLNESDYNNELNDVNYNWKISKFSFYGNYLLLKINNHNENKKEQLNNSLAISITSKLNANFGFSKDLVLNKIISRNYGLIYNGCCISYGLNITESNLGDFTKTQRSYNFNLTIKNL